MRIRFSALLTAMLLWLSGGVAQEAARTAEIFDRSGDAGQLTIRFLWLGEQVADDKPGDCMILTSPDGQVMVLDCGHPLSSQYVIDALDAMGVTRIDALVISHPHIDHLGGVPALYARYEIGTVYSSALVYEKSSYYRAYVEATANTPHVYLKEGDSFQFGDSVRVDVYNPPAEITYPKDYPTGATQFINNQSLALKFTYGESTAMLAGDLYAAGEREVVSRWGDALDCDIMKANHHGAGTSSTSVWRKAVSPQITFITSDTIEDLSIAKKYTKNGQQMYHTLIDGCIRVQTPGDGTYTVLTEKDRTTTLFD